LFPGIRIEVNIGIRIAVNMETRIASQYQVEAVVLEGMWNFSFMFILF